MAKKASTKKESAPKKKRLTKAEKEAAEEAARLKVKWTELRDLADGQKSAKYSMDKDFDPNTALTHPKLGWGYVLVSQNNRIEVLFEEGIRRLISNYKG